MTNIYNLMNNHFEDLFISISHKRQVILKASVSGYLPEPVVHTVTNKWRKVWVFIIRHLFKHHTPSDLKYWFVYHTSPLISGCSKRNKPFPMKAIEINHYRQKTLLILEICGDRSSLRYSKLWNLIEVAAIVQFSLFPSQSFLFKNQWTTFSCEIK